MLTDLYAGLRAAVCVNLPAGGHEGDREKWGAAGFLCPQWEKFQVLCFYITSQKRKSFLRIFRPNF